MNIRDFENTIVVYLATELGDSVRVEVGTTNSINTYVLNNSAGCVIVAFSGNPQFQPIPGTKRVESGTLVNRNFLEYQNYVLSIGYSSLRGIGESLYDLLETVKEKITNLNIDGYDYLTPLSVTPPVEKNGAWWLKLIFQTAMKLEVAIHDD